MAVVGKALFVNINSSKFEQVPFVMVHLKVTTLPALKIGRASCRERVYLAV